MLTKYLQEFDVEKFANELIENLDYVTDEEITQLQYKAQRIKGICKAAIKYRKRSEEADTKRQKKRVKKIEIASAATILNTDKIIH
ncbi:MAG TPA: hypothetical protein VGW09_03170 [Nitrososphaeraceae archaeon]|jgi:hypothetical protein|nr:hypothetical protein [Nitrososphaeraceae archaeon]HEV2876257.1 hypothetical protein [Nitrososphaeraceae archaeon]